MGITQKSCGNGMGMGIEIPLPRQPWGLQFPQYCFKYHGKFIRWFFNIILQKEEPQPGNYKYHRFLQT